MDENNKIMIVGAGNGTHPLVDAIKSGQIPDNLPNPFMSHSPDDTVESIVERQPEAIIIKSEDQQRLNVFREGIENLLEKFPMRRRKLLGILFAFIALTATGCSSEEDASAKYEALNAKAIEIINAENGVNVRSDATTGDKYEPTISYGKLSNGTMIELKDGQEFRIDGDPDKDGYENTWIGVPIDAIDESALFDKPLLSDIDKDSDGLAWINHKYVSVHETEE